MRGVNVCNCGVLIQHQRRAVQDGVKPSGSEGEQNKHEDKKCAAEAIHYLNLQKFSAQLPFVFSYSFTHHKLRLKG